MSLLSTLRNTTIEAAKDSESLAQKRLDIVANQLYETIKPKIVEDARKSAYSGNWDSELVLDFWEVVGELYNDATFVIYSHNLTSKYMVGMIQSKIKEDQDLSAIVHSISMSVESSSITLLNIYTNWSRND